MGQLIKFISKQQFVYAAEQYILLGRQYLKKIKTGIRQSDGRFANCNRQICNEQHLTQWWPSKPMHEWVTRPEVSYDAAAAWFIHWRNPQWQFSWKVVSFDYSALRIMLLSR